MTATDRDALYDALKANPGDDATRLIYADTLEDDGDAERAAQHRAIARMGLGLCEAIGDGQHLDRTQKSDIIDTYLAHCLGRCPEPEEREGIEVAEGFDGDLCVPFYRVGEEDIAWVTCTSRGDLDLRDLERDIEKAVADA